MKKRILIPLIGFSAIGFWWLATSAQSDYRTDAAARIAYTAVIMNSMDPQRLSRFYLETFGGTPVGAEDADVALRTPGYQGSGPLLKFRKLVALPARGPLQAFDPGYAHICFEADDVGAVARRFQENGGHIISQFNATDGALAFYGKDPDGNVVEVHLPFTTPLTPRTIYRTLSAMLRIKLDLPAAPDAQVRFIHVNINSTDWQETVAFYQSSLGASPIGFTRDYQGHYIGELTGVEGAAVQGRHVALPGYSKGGPTFEIFHYNKPSDLGPLGKDDLGRVMTEFVVADLDAVVARVRAAGGSIVDARDTGEILAKDVDGNLNMLRRQNTAPIGTVNTGEQD